VFNVGIYLSAVTNLGDLEDCFGTMLDVSDPCLLPRPEDVLIGMNAVVTRTVQTKHGGIDVWSVCERVTNIE